MKMHADTSRWQPTEAQRDAIEITDRSLAVSAAAGSGKTAVLIRRICRLAGIDDEGKGLVKTPDALDHLVAITFTEKAAGEMRSRLRALLPPHEHPRLDRAWIGTFHAFCARLLRRYGPLIGLTPSFRIMDEHAALLTMHEHAMKTLLGLLDQNDPPASELVEALGFSNCIGILEELLSARWHADQGLSPPRESDAEEHSLMMKMEQLYRQASSAYVEELLQLRQLDFQELEIRALLLLTRAPLKRKLQQLFTHILVDEFQDTSEIQSELLTQLYDPKSNHLFLVGDEAQSIYRFRGANVACFAHMRDVIRNAGGKTIRLAENFRSRKGVISFVNTCQELLAEGLFFEGTGESGMRGVRTEPATPPPSIVRLDLEGESPSSSAQMRRREADAIADEILLCIHERGFAPSAIALLFRAFTQLPVYEEALKRRSIPFKLSGGRGLLEQQEIRDLIAALRCAQNPTDRTALFAMLRSPLIGLSDDDLVLLAGPQGSSLLEGAYADPRCWLIRRLPEMAAHEKPSEILKQVIFSTGYEYICSRIDPSGSMIANIDRFLTMLQAMERDIPMTIGGCIEFLAALRQRKTGMGTPPASADQAASISVMTVHAAKGLEFPVVILPDLFHQSPARSKPWIFQKAPEDGARPALGLSMRDPARPFGKRLETPSLKAMRQEERSQDRMESQRLLYVAMTRARDLLILPMHHTVPREKETWHAWLRQAFDRFVEPEKGALEHRTDVSAHRKKLRAANEMKASLPEVLNTTAIPHQTPQRAFTVSQLESYAQCPLKYHLRYNLSLPAGHLPGDQPTSVEKEVFGSIVHDVLSLRPQEEASLPQAIRNAALAYGVLPDAQMMQEVQEQVRETRRLAGFAGFDEGMRELAFEWKVDEVIVTGSIDWLRPTKEAFDVIDYKTGDVDTQDLLQRAAEYDLQLTAYALAAEAMTGKVVKNTILLFPKAGLIHAEPMHQARRHRTLKHIRQIISAIEEGDFQVRRTPPCRTCPYRINTICWHAATSKRPASKVRKQTHLTQRSRTARQSARTTTRRRR